MKLLYITNARIPTEKAHGLATMKLCEAFAKKGIEVTLVVPRRINPLKDDPYVYYGMESNFRIKRLPSFDVLWLGVEERFFFLLQLFSFSMVAALWLFFRSIFSGAKDVIVFSHDHIPLYFASLFASHLVYDVHHYPERTSPYKRVLGRAELIAVQTKWKIAKLKEDFGVPQEKIVYWPNGTDAERFNISASQHEARGILSLPQDKKIALYTGQLFSWKGVDTLIDAAVFLPPDVPIYIVGGEKAEVEKSKLKNQKSELRNVIFIGQRPWTEMPVWMKAADVLILPNTGKEKVSLYYTSPMKLFEYMASGRPIVASDIPSIREIVDETMVFFATPDDPRSFARVIQEALASPEETKKRAEKALREAQKYTWEARAGKIIEKMTTLI